MELEIIDHEDVKVVRVGAARLSYPILSDFFARIRELADSGAVRLLLDLNAVTYMDSAAIGCLMDVHHLVHGRRGVLRVCRLTPRVATMLSMTGVDRVIGVHATCEEAFAAFAGGSAAQDSQDEV